MRTALDIPRLIRLLFFGTVCRRKGSDTSEVVAGGIRIFGRERDCSAIIVAPKSSFTLAGITNLRGEILRDLGMTPANLIDTQSKYICTGLCLSRRGREA